MRDTMRWTVAMALGIGVSAIGVGAQTASAQMPGMGMQAAPGMPSAARIRNISGSCRRHRHRIGTRSRPGLPTSCEGWSTRRRGKRTDERWDGLIFRTLQ